jgi:hypothetical protein
MSLIALAPDARIAVTCCDVRSECTSTSPPADADVTWTSVCAIARQLICRSTYNVQKVCDLPIKRASWVRSGGPMRNVRQACIPVRTCQSDVRYTTCNTFNVQRAGTRDTYAVDTAQANRRRSTYGGRVSLETLDDLALLEVPYMDQLLGASRT